ncbi:MAG: hypothetical protein ACYDHY_19790 [Acidiferrobacterales bacterium]
MIKPARQQRPPHYAAVEVDPPRPVPRNETGMLLVTFEMSLNKSSAKLTGNQA